MEIAAGAPLIRVDRVGKAYHFGRQTTRAIDEVSLSVAPGSFLSIIGPSGCGKSTLLQMIAGLIAPTNGSVSFHGMPVTAPPHGMIYVFQQYEKSIFPWRTVIDNVAFGIEGRRDLSRADRRERCMTYLELVGLKAVADRYPAQLSGGMQQRVAIARALICEPDVLLMDEPFSAVDALTRAVLQDLLLTVWARIPLTVLFVTHDVEEAIYLSTEVVSLTRSPARVGDRIEVELASPRDQVRTRETPAFLDYRHRLFAAVFAQETAGVTSG